MDMQAIQSFLSTTVTELGIKILAAIAFWIVGRWLIGRVIAMMQAAMNRNAVDPTLTKYLGSIVAIALNITLVLGILGYFGIQTTSIAAMLAGAGVAIGAAWSGMLGNFAAGAFMLVLRPFKVGDFVSIGGVTGTVHELGLFGTTIVTPDNVLTLIGNGNATLVDNTWVGSPGLDAFLQEYALGIPAILGVYLWVIWRWGFGPEDRVLFKR